MKRFTEWGLALSIISLPFNLSFLVWQNAWTQSSTFNAYSSISIYGSEIIIWITLLFWWLGNKKEPKNNSTLLGFTEMSALGLLTILGIHSLLISENSISSLGGVFHMATGLIFIKLFHSQILTPQTRRKIFYSTILIQAVLALIQFGFQHSIGLHFLGEPWITRTLPGVAKINWGENTFLRAYGTLSHSNILGGYMVIALLMWIHEGKTTFKSKTLKSIAPVFFALGGIVSFSKGALLALITGCTLTKKITPLIGGGIALLILGIAIINWNALSQHEFIQERLLYADISLHMLWSHPEGVGINQFTEQMQAFTDIKLQPWQFQPGHNVFLLAATEWGILSFALILIGGGILFKKKRGQPQFLAILTGLLTLGLFDHYLISSYPGILLTALVLAQTKSTH